jgi:histidinol phosphatase-like PHP family hydrolase
VIDFHTHTLLSDGVLCPAELVQRAKQHGYRVLGIADHIDAAKLDWVIPAIVRFCRELETVERDITVIPGAELTHLPPPLIPRYVELCREKGARFVIVHGETIVEPVPPGTNRAAIEAGVDILAHPGLISESDVQEAAGKGIFLEISARKGHSLTNGHVASLARKFDAPLLINTDAHAPEDLLPLRQAKMILKGCGLSEAEIQRVLENSEKLAQKLTQ